MERINIEIIYEEIPLTIVGGFSAGVQGDWMVTPEPPEIIIEEIIHEGQDIFYLIDLSILSDIEDEVITKLMNE